MPESKLEQFEVGDVIIVANKLARTGPEYPQGHVLQVIPEDKDYVARLEVNLGWDGPPTIPVDYCLRIEERQLPPTYSHETRSCRRCRHVFKKTDYDSEETYFCLKNAPHPRPPCGSVAMGECFFPERGAMREEFEWWYRFREVAAWGVCAEYKGL